MIHTYSLNGSAKQLNNLKVCDFGVPHMDNFSMITMDITLKRQHILVFPFYLLDNRFQNVNMIGFPKFYIHSCTGIYLGHLPFRAISVALILDPVNGHLLPQ